MEDIDNAMRLIHFMQVMSIFFTGSAVGVLVILSLQWIWRDKKKNDKVTGI